MALIPTSEVGMAQAKLAPPKEAVKWTGPIWNTSYYTTTETSGAIVYAGFSPADPKRLVTADANGTIRVWELGEPLVLDGTLFSRWGPIDSVFWGPDPNTYASRGLTSRIYLWNLTPVPAPGNVGELTQLLERAKPYLKKPSSGESKKGP
jgi:hypothetical protein